MADIDDTERRTNLAVPIWLVDRIEVQAKADRRPYKQELLTLLEEAVDKREKRFPRQPMPSD